MSMTVPGQVRPGDEIIMPSYTFVSTANAFVLRSAVAARELLGRARECRAWDERDQRCRDHAQGLDVLIEHRRE